MQRIVLDVTLREGRGKSATRKLRAQGLVPGVLYGTGIEATSLTVSAQKLDRIAAVGANTLVDLAGPKEVKGKLVLIKELQRDPVSLRPVHCDFLAVDTRKRISVQVPIHVEGKPEGVDMGGVLEAVLREVEVSCMPLAIPDSLSIDVSPLGIGDALHVSDLRPPEGVEIQDDPTRVILHVLAPRVEEEAAPEAEAAVAAGEAPAEGAAAEGEARAEKSEKGEDSGG